MARWRSLDPRTEEWVDYEESVCNSLERQYQTGQRSGEIQVKGHTFTMDFTPGNMLQINDKGLGRRVERIECEVGSKRTGACTIIEPVKETEFTLPVGIQWYSEDPRTGDWVEYDEAASVWLEEQYASGRPKGTVRVAGMLFDMDFSKGAMEQINAQGYARPVLRIVAGDASASASPARGHKRSSQHAGEIAKWRSLDPRTGRWVDYSPEISRYLEARYQHGKDACKLNMDGNSFCVHFGSSGMWQENDQGGWREVERATQSADSVQWQFRDKGTGQWVDYDSATTASLEAQYQEENKFGMISVGDMTSVVHFTPGCMNQVSGSGLCQDIQRIEAATEQAAPRPVAVVVDDLVPDPAAAIRPMMYVEGSGWTEYDVDARSIVVIGPGAGTRANLNVYRELETAGYVLHIVHGGSYDKYPPGWQDGRPDRSFNHGNNLAALADDDVYSTIAGLVKKGRGPCAIIAGSRGGQVTTPRLWKRGWRGPTVVINGGCIMTTQVPGAPVRLVLYTCGHDFFHTKDPEFTRASIRKKDTSQPVLLYHHPSESHMPDRLGQGVLQRLVELARDGFSEDQLAVAPRGAPWPAKAILETI